MSYPYRCSKAKCRKRVTLPRKVEQYARAKVCPACKCDSLKLDMAHRAESKRNRCHCAGYHFPHRKGSLYCDHASEGSIGNHLSELKDREDSIGRWYVPALGMTG